MIKRTISSFAIIAFLLINLSSFAQSNTDFDERLLTKFSKKEILEMNTSDLSYWTYYLDNGYKIAPIPKEKPDAFPNEVKLKSLKKEDINILSLGLKPHAVVTQYYRIKGTDKILLLLNEKEVTRNLNATK